MANTIYHGRHTAHIEGDFVVFLIGAHFKMRDLFRAKWIGDSFYEMQTDLAARPDSGFLGGKNYFRVFPIEAILVSYWRSFDHLEHFSRSRDELHYPAWLRFYKDVGLKSDIGIWHETYMIRAGEYECIYGNMPKFGLGNAREVTHMPLKDASRARQRSAQDDKPETVASPEPEVIA